MNSQSDLDNAKTFFASIPSAADNALRTMEVGQGQAEQLIIRKTDSDIFCYYCFYYITVFTNTTSGAQYNIEARLNRELNEDAIDIPLNQPEDE